MTKHGPGKTFLKMLVLEREMIDVVDYNPLWPQTFQQLRDRYIAALGVVPWIAIEHVGSTAVDGLAAKPIIDIDIIVTSEHVNSATEVLKAIDFEPLGEMGIASRWAFRAPIQLPRTNTYVVERSSLALRNHLGIRDLLRSDPLLRNEYTELKKQLALTVADMATYVEAKSAFISRMLEKVGFTEIERATIEAANRR